jgi:hypothetical protein
LAYPGYYFNSTQNSLTRLSQIRLLHLRLHHFQVVGHEAEYDKISPLIVSSQTQKFANKFFDDLKRVGRCPFLIAPIIRHVSDPKFESADTRVSKILLP